jgi:hypothetical protein
LFGKADQAHAQAYARREKFRQLATAGAAAQKPALAAYGRWGEMLGSPFQHTADAWMAHLLRQAKYHAKPHAGSVMARAQVVLFGNHHWVRQLAGLVVLQLVVLLGFVWANSTTSLAQALVASHASISIGLVGIITAAVIGIRSVVWGSRREQALLVLLPGMPQGRALNQALARQQIKHYLLMWAASLPAFAGLAYWAQAPQVWGIAAAALPLAALLWRDVSRLRAPSPEGGMWLYLLSMAVALLMMLLLRWQPLLLVPAVVCLLAVTAAMLTWRWRRVSQWPQALPAGRLA